MWTAFVDDPHPNLKFFKCNCINFHACFFIHLGLQHYLKPKNDSINARQMWKKGKVNRDGYFTLQNTASGQYLTADNYGEITLAGNQIKAL